MAKDPAILFYIDAWLVSTKEMKADERGWYLNLILHQSDKGDLPNDIEELANLADVRFSEFDLFKQKWEQVLKQKFKQNEKGRLINEVAHDILKKRELFKDKRAESGKIGYIIKLAINELSATPEQVEYIKNNLDFNSIDIKNKQVLKQVLKQTVKLYINRNRNRNRNIDNNIEGVQGEEDDFVPVENYEFYPFEEFWNDYEKKVGDKDKLEKKWAKVPIREREKIKDYIVRYKEAEPVKKFRKNPETFLNNKSWNDEIIEGVKNTPIAPPRKGTSLSDMQEILDEHSNAQLYGSN